MVNEYQELFKKDYDMGKKNEKKVVNWLNENSDQKYYIQKWKYSIMDFKKYDDDNFVGELKSRNELHNNYPTAMIGKNKINRVLKNDKLNVKFYFLYQDGLFYWNLNKEEYTEGKWCRNNRGKYETSDICYISHEHLKLLTDEINSL